jgi:hypothetical protein
LVLKQQAILAVGMDGHCCTRLKGKQHSRQNAMPQSCIQKWTFLGDFGNNDDQSFLKFTQSLVLTQEAIVAIVTEISRLQD